MDTSSYMPSAGEPVARRHSRGLLHLLYDLYIRPAPPALKARLTKELHRLLIGYGESDNFPHLIQELEASEKHAHQQHHQAGSKSKQQTASGTPSGATAVPQASTAAAAPGHSDDSGDEDSEGAANDNVLIDAAEEMLSIAKAASDKAAALLRQTADTARQHAREARRLAALQDLKHRRVGRQPAAEAVPQPVTPARPPVAKPQLSPPDQPKRIPVSNPSTQGTSTSPQAPEAQGTSSANGQGASDPGHVKVTITPAGVDASQGKPVQVSVAAAEGPGTPETRGTNLGVKASQMQSASNTHQASNDPNQQQSTPTKSAHPSINSSKPPRAPVQGSTQSPPTSSSPLQGQPDYMQPTESSMARASAKPRPSINSSTSYTTTQYLDAADIALDPELSLEVSTLLADAQALLAAAQAKLLEDQAFLQHLDLQEEGEGTKPGGQQSRDQGQQYNRLQEGAQQQEKHAAGEGSPHTPTKHRIPVLDTTTSNASTPTYPPYTAPAAPPSASKATGSAQARSSSPQHAPTKAPQAAESHAEPSASTPRYMPGPRLHDGPPEDHGHVPVEPPWLPPGPTTAESSAIHHHIRPGGTSMTYEIAAPETEAPPTSQHRTARRSLTDQLDSAGAAPSSPQPATNHPATFSDWYPSRRPLAAAGEIQQQLLGREVPRPTSSSTTLPYLPPHYPSVTRDCLAAHAVQQYIEDPDGTTALGGSSIYVDPLLTPEASFASAAELLQQQSQSTPGYMQPTWSHLLKRSKKYEGGSILSPAFYENQEVRKQRGLAPCTPVPLVPERPASSPAKSSKPRTTFREWLAEQKSQQQHQSQQ
jgi:hypothetical protein